MVYQAKTPGFGPGKWGSSPCPSVRFVRALCEHVFVAPRYSEIEARKAVEASLSLTEALRRLGMRPAGGNHATLRRCIDIWKISTDHFDPRAAQRAALRRDPIPLSEVLVRRSTYSRSTLKRRLLREGIKKPQCEMCGQGELWNGPRMALILDHINGFANDNRLENLQLICPNCAATLATHCGRNRPLPEAFTCLRCGAEFFPGGSSQQYCSLSCASRENGLRFRGPRPSAWKVPHPPHEELANNTDSWPPAAATASPITRFASGCANMSVTPKRRAQ